MLLITLFKNFKVNKKKMHKFLYTLLLSINSIFKELIQKSINNNRIKY